MDVISIIRFVLTFIRDLPSPINLLVIYSFCLLISIIFAITILRIILGTPSRTRFLIFEINSLLDKWQYQKQVRKKQARSRVNPSRRNSDNPALLIHNHKLYKKLLQLLHDDEGALLRLINRQKIKNPGMNQDWYLEKILWDLERDRSRGLY